VEKCLKDVAREKRALDLLWDNRMRYRGFKQAVGEAMQRESVESLLAQVQQLLKKVVIGLAAQQAEIERLHRGNNSFRVEKPSWILIAHLRGKPGNV